MLSIWCMLVRDLHASVQGEVAGRKPRDGPSGLLSWLADALFVTF